MSKMQNNKKKNTDVYYKSATLFLLAILFLILAFSTSTSELASKAQKKEDVNIQHILPEDKFADIVLEAKSAFVFQPLTGRVLYEKNADAQLALASITKIMSALVAAENITPQGIVSIPESSIETEGDSGLLANERWKILDLLNFTLMVSSNDGADALANVISATNRSATLSKKEQRFVDLMNEKAKKMDLKQTYFLNNTGLDLNDFQSGAYGSARDVARLFAYAVNKIPIALEATNKKDLLFESQSGFKHYAINTNKAIPDIPGFIAGKTGYTDLAGGNLVVEYDVFGEPTVAVVLGSTKNGRFRDIAELVKRSSE